MVHGMSTFTFVHVLISLVGIGSGIVVMLGLIARRRLAGWTALFLATTLLTSLTGFGFPFTHLLPSHILGIVSLVMLAVALPARYVFRLAGAWRPAYVVTAMIALYLNVFVLIFQIFLKLPAAHALAPTQSEPPFLVAQLATLALFVVLTIVAAVRFHPAPGVAATPAMAR